MSSLLEEGGSRSSDAGRHDATEFRVGELVAASHPARWGRTSRPTSMRTSMTTPGTTPAKRGSVDSVDSVDSVVLVDTADASVIGGGDVEMAHVRRHGSRHGGAAATVPAAAAAVAPKPATAAAAHRCSVLFACSHLWAVSSQLLHGLACMRVLSFVLGAVWVACVCAVPVVNNVAVRFLFSPASSAGSVSIDTFVWWCACFVCMATGIYGARLMLHEYIAARFTHRAHVTVARAVAKGALWAHDAAGIGHNLRAARRCILEHVPSMARTACQSVVFLGLAYSQSASVGNGLLGLLFGLSVLHLAEEMLHAHSMAVLHRSSSNSLAKVEDPEQGVHRLTRITHHATLWRAALTTLYTLLEFISPLVLLLCAVVDIRAARAGESAGESATADTSMGVAVSSAAGGNATAAGNTAASDEPVYADAFQLLLAFTASIGALLSSHDFHASASSALKCMDAVLTVVELDLGSGWGGNSSTNPKTATTQNSNNNNTKKSPGLSCGGRAPVIIALVCSCLITAVIISLAVAGQGLTHFGCSSIQIECSLGTDRRQTVIVRQAQSYDLATGCKFDSNSEKLLSKCLVALAPGTGYGLSDIVSSPADGNTSFGADYNYTATAQNTQRTQLVSSGTSANYTETQVREAATGKSLSRGGLNVDEIKRVLVWNSVAYSSSSSRSALEQLLVSLLAEIDAAQAVTAEAWDSTTDPSLRSFQELLVDGSEADVALKARYDNWRGEEEVLVTHVSWAQIAAVAEAHSGGDLDIDDMQDTSDGEHGRRLMFVSSDAVPELRGDITFHHRVRGESHGLVDYKVKVKLGSKRSAGTKDTITVQMHGSHGSSSGYATLGDAWEAGTERTVVLAGMKEVGAVVQVTLMTSGKDGVDFEEIWVTHTEDPNTASRTVAGSGANIDAGADSSSTTGSATSRGTVQTMDVGSLVTVGTGKYKGCEGNVAKFSPNTGKPQVCRDCTMTTPSGVKCCGSSSCGYYGTDQVELKQDSVSSSSKSAGAFFSSDSAALVAADPERLRKGHSVSVLSGKYQGCTGTVAKFSQATNRPQVCRNCDQVGSDGQSCCGSTARSKCSYASVDNVECLDCMAGTAAAAKATTASAEKKPLVEHSSFFTMKAYLKCSGSKRSGTWSCSETLDATRAPGETHDDASGSPASDSSASSNTNCAKEGDAGWQGDARVVGSTFDDVSLIGPMEYSFGKLWIDPLARGASRFQYTARRDCGSLDRHGSFKVDAKHKKIQQTTGRSYPKYCVAPKRGGEPWSLDGLNSGEIKDQCSKYVAYDRGHLVPANHFDHDKKIITETNLMINILPQASKMNRGAWLETEMITECLREEEVLTVLGGAVYPASPEGSTEAEFFRKSHGVVTPTHFWKIIAAKPTGRYAADNGLIAFWMPNSDVAAAKRTSEYVVSISELEENLAQAGFRGGGRGWPSRSAAEVFDLPQSVKDHVPSFWGTLEGCDRS